MMPDSEEELVFSFSKTSQSLRKSLLSILPGAEQFKQRTGEIIADSLHYILDGEDNISCLESCEKAFIGVKFEKRFLKALGLPVNTKNSKRDRKGQGRKTLDTVLDGIDIDIKFTIGKNWMIPPETVGEWSVLVRADYSKNIYSLGIMFLDKDLLTNGENRDKKITVSGMGMHHINWLVVDYPIPQNRK